MPLRNRAAHLLTRAAGRLDPASRPRPGRRSAGPATGRTAGRGVGAAAVPPLTSTSAPGSRKITNFFDDYPRFYETSVTSPAKGRLNMRYEAIFGENRNLFAGKKVLDIASHDGRWSLAALACGAESVIGIEARPELIAHATENLAHYGFGSDRVSFVAGDVHDVFEKETFDVDTVLCLGFLYHTLRYNELMRGVRKADPEHLIIDTQSRWMMQPAPMVYMMSEQADWQGNAVSDELSFGDTVLTGRPNLEAIRTMVQCYGFEVTGLSDWGGILRDNPGLKGAGDYQAQSRTTIICRDTQR